ncbi:MAG: bifunctional nicotinamidase/pyrazinamidase [bacterium]|nr:bifunctional nicotinamidase/pyrazinamidase [bacterium]
MNEYTMKALLIVDLQNDFCSKGSLPVPHGDEVVPIANKLISDFSSNGHIIAATKDWHPVEHGSFASVNKAPLYSLSSLNEISQVMWPDHCVQNTKGAEFHQELLNIPNIFYKGTDKNVDSYSGFFDNDGKSDTGLHNYLQKKSINELFILGLATDYCVKFTAIDAKHLGYKTNVVLDGCRGIDNPKGSIDKAIDEMSLKGIKIMSSDKIELIG